MRHADFQVRRTPRPDEALALLGTWRPQLVMVDGDAEPRSVATLDDAPQRDEFALVAMTVHRRITRKLELFAAGADDIIEAPFTPDELIGRPIGLLGRLRIRRMVFRPVISAGALRLDLAKEGVETNGHHVSLPIEELAVLYLLAANPEATMTRDEIARALWGSDLIPEPEKLDRYLSHLRDIDPTALIGASGAAFHVYRG